MRRFRFARIWLGAAVMGVVLVTACGSVQGVPPNAPADSLGQIAGQVMRGPGVDPRSGGASSSSRIPVSGDPVEIRNGSGDVVARAVTSQDGSFRIDIAPGAYTVVESICAVKQQVDVRSQAVTQLTLTLPANC